MTFPKLHHYVPRFYLDRFTDADGRIWAWDKSRDASFRTNPAGLAAETHFYRQDDLAEAGYDPLAMEKQLAGIEGEVAKITGQWIDWLPEVGSGERIPIPEANREIVSLFLGLQYLRTLDVREILVALSDPRVPLSDADRRRLHTSLLWDEPIFRALADRFRKSAWIFGRNQTATPFLTCDNPITFRTPDNRRWVRAGILSAGVYAGYPISPKLILFCRQ